MGTVHVQMMFSLVYCSHRSAVGINDSDRVSNRPIYTMEDLRGPAKMRNTSVI